MAANDVVITGDLDGEVASFAYEFNREIETTADIHVSQLRRAARKLEELATRAEVVA